MTTTQKFVQTPVASLVASIGTTDTSISISPFPRDLENVKLTITDFGSTPSATIDPKISGVEEIISFTGITDNGDNTATLTGVTRNLSSKSPYTTVGAGRQHGANAILVFTDNPQLFNRLSSQENDETITGLKTYTQIPVLPASNPTTGNQATRKTYVDGLDTLAAHLAGSETFTGVKTFTTASRPKLSIDTDTTVVEELVTYGQLSRQAVSGAPNGSTTVKGIFEEATQAEIEAGTAAGATGARLAINPSTLLLALPQIVTTPTVTTIIPKTIFASPITITASGKTSNTRMDVGLINIPQKIIVNKLSIYHGTITTIGTCKVGIYSEDGQTKLLDLTTGSMSGGTATTTTSLGSPLTLAAGNYYIAIVPNGTFNGEIYFQYPTTSTEYGAFSVLASEPSYVGYMAVTASTLPTTFLPASALTTEMFSTIIARLDN